MLRIKPGIEAHTHEYIKTGHIDSKFGFAMEEALTIIQSIHSEPWATFIGIHAHIGSQIFDSEPYHDLVSILIKFLTTLNSHNIQVDELNCGGGFGIQYLESDSPQNIPDTISKMANQITEKCNSNNLKHPKLIFEPGRSIIANCGVTVYTVGATKKVSKTKEYLFVDGGMADNPRPIMYKANHTFEVIQPETDLKTNYTIAGKFCESGDILATDIKLPIVSPNNQIVVYGTGAYNYSMASNYNRFCKPAMILVNNGNATQLIRRETYEDIIRFDEP